MSRHDMIKGIIPPIITPMNEDRALMRQRSANRSRDRLRAAYMVFSAMVQTENATH